ncbi:MAG: hypothetical protein Q4Q62_05900 [Thermoplasmata archaeon]|nr:hypothetical protein [Thermoplasmata archaeon]
MQDLSFRSLEAAVIRRGVPRPVTLGGMARGGEYTNLALMLSDQCPWRTVFRVDGEMVCDLRGSVLDQVEESAGIVSAIRDGMPTGSSNLASSVFRELVLNAACHRSYCSPEPTFVDVGPSEITVSSPGEPVRLGAEFRLRTRNPALTETLLAMGYRDRGVRSAAGAFIQYTDS